MQMVEVAVIMSSLLQADCNEQSPQNWRGPGESDCIIETKHCDGANACDAI